MGMRVVLVLTAALLAVSTSGCIVPDNMQVLREELGFSSLKAPIVKIRASTLEPVVRQPVVFTAVAVGGTGVPTAYIWDFDGRSETGESVTHAWPATGIHVVTLKVTTAKGAIGTDAVTVEVGPNTKPVAVGSVDGEPRAVAGEPVTFTAARSTDPDGNTLSYTWAFDDGASAEGAVVQHVFASAGAHRATLTVSDGVDTDTTRVGVAVDERVAATGSAGAVSSYALPFSVAARSQALSGTVAFTRPLLLEEIELVFAGPDGSTHVVPSQGGLLTSASSVPFRLDRPAEGAWGLTVRLVRGAETDVKADLTVAYEVPS